MTGLMAIEALSVGHLLRTFPGKVSGFITVETRRSRGTLIRTYAGQVSGLVAVKALHNALGLVGQSRDKCPGCLQLKHLRALTSGHSREK